MHLSQIFGNLSTFCLFNLRFFLAWNFPEIDGIFEWPTPLSRDIVSLFVCIYLAGPPPTYLYKLFFCLSSCIFLLAVRRLIGFASHRTLLKKWKYTKQSPLTNECAIIGRLLCSSLKYSSSNWRASGYCWKSLGRLASFSHLELAIFRRNFRLIWL